MENTNKLELTENQLRTAIAAVSEHIVDINRTRFNHPQRFDEWNSAMDEALETLNVLTAAQEGSR